MYSSIYCTLKLFWPGGLDVRRKLWELERTQWLSREQLEAWQLVRLQKLVKHAYEHVPYYHDLYRSLDIHPEDIKTLKDFQSLPFLTREDVINHLESLICPELRHQAQTRFTGGSTGQPMRFVIDQLFRRWDLALEFRGRGWYGAREGDKIAFVWGVETDLHVRNWRARLKAKILRERYLNAFCMTEANMRAFADMLVGWQPQILRAYAVALSLFAQSVKDRGIEGIRPRLIELTSEKVTDRQRRLLQEVFQCKVADWYSSRELGTIALQCPQGGQHVCETRFLEIVTGGRVLGPGELGEVVITSTHQYTMPFIRYKIGDMAVYEPGTCSCGRGLPVLRQVVGRTNDFVVTPDGRFMDSGYFDSVLEIKPEIARYQVHQSDKHHLQVRLVCKREVGQHWLEGVHRELQAYLGADMHISMQVVDSIPLTSAGKHRCFTSAIELPSFLRHGERARQVPGDVPPEE